MGRPSSYTDVKSWLTERDLEMLELIQNSKRFGKSPGELANHSDWDKMKKLERMLQKVGNGPSL